MERLENILKDLQGTARKLRKEIRDAEDKINELYSEYDFYGMTPEIEHQFDDALNATWELTENLNKFLDY